MTTAEPIISAKQKRWTLPPAFPDTEVISNLAQELKLPEFITALLVQRGLGDSAAAFLRPEFRSLHDPLLLPNMSGAVERLLRALKSHEKILLFGDYDVDGITGTAMLWHILAAAGAQDRVQIYIPHRVNEGYGLSCDAIERVIDAGAHLIVTIDCGGSANEPIETACDCGIDVIVTDHHELPATLPPALAIVHPRLPGSAYPNPDLCGAGVAYKLAWALATQLCGGGKVNDVYKNLLIEFTALVALATIADVVPLIGENRVLAKYGLQQLTRTKLPGLPALMEAAGYAGKKMDCTAVGFGLAPRLNAAGRMDHADLAVELLTTATPTRAAEIAQYLEEQNRQRQSTEKKMVDAAVGQIESWESLPHVLVVHSEAHHAGVAGIVASRLVELYHRPAFVLACDEQICHGSARSIPGFEIHSAIDHCRPLLISGGGHAMAGGLKLKRENLEPFRAAVNEYAAQILTPDHFIPVLNVDGELTLHDATLASITKLMEFQPFGRGNPHPRFILQRVRLSAPPRPVGATGAHLQIQFSQGTRQARGIAFKAGALVLHNELHPGLELDLVVEPKIDYYNNMAKVDFIIQDMARSDGLPLYLEAPPQRAPREAFT